MALGSEVKGQQQTTASEAGKGEGRRSVGASEIGEGGAEKSGKMASKEDGESGQNGHADDEGGGRSFSRPPSYAAAARKQSSGASTAPSTPPATNGKTEPQNSIEKTGCPHAKLSGSLVNGNGDLPNVKDSVNKTSSNVCTKVPISNGTTHVTKVLNGDIKTDSECDISSNKSKKLLIVNGVNLDSKDAESNGPEKEPETKTKTKDKTVETNEKVNGDVKLLNGDKSDGDKTNTDSTTSDDDDKKREPEVVFIQDMGFTVKIVSPGAEPVDIHVSSMELVQEIHQLLMDREDTCHRTCFSLQLDGVTLDNFAELKNIEGLKEGSVIKVVEEAYTMREARIHVRHVRDLLKSIDSSDAYAGQECSSLAFLNIVTQGDILEKKKTRPESVDCTPPDYIMPNSKERPLLPLHPGLNKENKSPQSLKVLTTSGWNPPPGARKMCGDLLYLHVVTLEDRHFHITACSRGFYLNQSTEDTFNPRPANPSLLCHSLIELLSIVSPLFKRSFAAIQKRRTQKHPFERVATPYQVYQWASPHLENTVDAIRAEDTFSSKLGYEEHIPGQTRDWNEELQTTRELPRATLPERLLRERAIFKVHSDFVAAATRGAVAVVDGNVMAINPGEDPKMQMFIWNNIFFSLGFDVRDHYKELGGDAAAFVAPRNDLQGVRVYSAVDTPGLHTLGTVVVDYRGHRVTAQSIIPGILEKEQEQSVVYGSIDFGTTVLSHPKYMELLSAAGQQLKILPHSVTSASGETVELCSSVECKGIIGNDGRHYILDLLRTFPPDVNFLQLEDEELSNEVKEMGFPIIHKHKLCCLRQELVDSFVEARYFMFIRYAAFHLQQLGAKRQREAGEQKAIEDKKEGDKCPFKKEKELEKCQVNKEKETEKCPINKENEPEKCPVKKEKELDKCPVKKEKDDECEIKKEKEDEKCAKKDTEDKENRKSQEKEVKPQESKKEKKKREKKEEKPAEVKETPKEEKKKSVELNLNEEDPELDADAAKKMVESITDSICSGDKQEMAESSRAVVESAARAVGSLKTAEFDIRFNPDVYSAGIKHAATREQLDQQRHLVKEAAAFLLTTQIPAFVRECAEQSSTIMDGAGLTEALHARGINVRYLGKVCAALRAQPSLAYLHSIAVAELVLRANKHIFTHYLQSCEAMYLGAAVSHFLNCLLSACGNPALPASEEPVAARGNAARARGRRTRRHQHASAQPSAPEWHSLTPKSLFSQIRHELKSYWGYELTTDNMEQTIEKYGLQKISLLRSFALKVGLQVLLREYDFDSKNKPTFTCGDIMNIFPVVKHINPRASDAYNFYTTGQSKIQAGSVSEGHELIAEALNLLNNVYGAMHGEIAQCLRMVARLCYVTGEHRDALAYQQKAVLMSERVNGIDHPYTITEYSHLALYCFANSQVSSALKLLYRARYLALLVCGEHHPEMALLDSNISLILHAVGEYELSLRFLERALAVTSAVHGARSIKAAVARHLLARTLSCLGDFRAALAHEKDTYSIYRQLLGEKHEKTRESSECLRHLTQQAVVLQKRLNEAAGAPARHPPPPIHIQPPSMGSVLDMLNLINGILFVQISPQDIEHFKAELEKRHLKDLPVPDAPAQTKDSSLDNGDQPTKQAALAQS